MNKKFKTNKIVFINSNVVAPMTVRYYSILNLSVPRIINVTEERAAFPFSVITRPTYSAADIKSIVIIDNMTLYYTCSIKAGRDKDDLFSFLGAFINVTKCRITSSSAAPLLLCALRLLMITNLFLSTKFITFISQLSMRIYIPQYLFILGNTLARKVTSDNKVSGRVIGTLSPEVKCTYYVEPFLKMSYPDAQSLLISSPFKMAIRDAKTWADITEELSGEIDQYNLNAMSDHSSHIDYVEYSTSILETQIGSSYMVMDRYAFETEPCPKLGLYRMLWIKGLTFSVSQTSVLHVHEELMGFIYCFSRLWVPKIKINGETPSTNSLHFGDFRADLSRLVKQDCWQFVLSQRIRRVARKSKKSASTHKQQSEIASTTDENASDDE